MLDLAALSAEITVSSGNTEVGASSNSNVDAITIDQNMLESLPMFDNDFVATMSQFLDAGSIGNGGVTIVVNGMEVSALNVSASAMQQIKINQDPYSAEYSRPGRGRIEILTKPGGQTYSRRGHADLPRRVVQRAQRVRDDQAAGTAAASTRASSAARSGTSGKTSFMLSANDEILRSAVVHLRRRAGRHHPGHAAAQQRPGAGQRQHHAADQRQEHVLDPAELPVRERREPRRRRHDAGERRRRTFKHHEQQVTYTQQTILAPTLLNQFQMLVGHEREPTISASPTRGIVVNGAFTGGGAQADLRADRDAHAT